MKKRKRRVQLAIWQDDKIVLLKHRNLVSGKSFWGLPGGGQEKGETWQETARREAKEETGLDIELLGKPHLFAAPLPEYYDEALTILAQPKSGKLLCGNEPEPDTDFELTKAKWFSLPEIRQLNPQLWQEISIILAHFKNGWATLP